MAMSTFVMINPLDAPPIAGQRSVGLHHPMTRNRHRDCVRYSLHEPRRGREDVMKFMTGFREAFPDLKFAGISMNMSVRVKS
jgi:hypothetical protein